MLNGRGHNAPANGAVQRKNNGYSLLRCGKICTVAGLNVTGKNLSGILPIA
jgi:hypothetical protein